MIIGKLKIFEKRVIGDGPEGPLRIRWILFRVPSFGIFLHKLCRSDHDRALHDHPWSFLSVVLKGGYDEIRYVRTITQIGVYGRFEEDEHQHHSVGSILFRPAEWRHRVIINDKPAWTLVFVGLNRRRWGFWPTGEFCWWRKYNPDKGICEENPICPEQDD
jgi:hypothetical protein